MRVLVLGSGVVGVTAACYLNRAGHEVTVLDRAGSPGMETSFANGGQISWGAGNPWAAPGIVGTALKWLFKPHSPLVLHPRLDPAMWSWLVNSSAMPRLHAMSSIRNACCASRATATSA